MLPAASLGRFPACPNIFIFPSSARRTLLPKGVVRVRLLVVEDSVKMAALLRRGFEEEGYAVDVALDGAQALWLARENPYDAVVLDVVLDHDASGPDGFDVCRTLRPEG